MGAHRWMSWRTNSANSAELNVFELAPSRWSCSRIFGSFSAATTASFNFFVTLPGNFAGPNSPNQASDSNPFTISPIAGVSGNESAASRS